jgi:cell wall assembly regulator SMI1
VGHVACIGKIRNVYKILVGKPEGKRPLGRPRCRWEDKTEMDLNEVVLEGIDWIHLAQGRDRWAGSCEHGNECSGSMKGRESD